MLSLEKKPLFAMIDTETIYLRKRIYELAVVVFDSVTCEIVDKKSWYIKETLESTVYYQLRHNKPPIFWPSRLNPLALLKEAINWEQAIDEFTLLLSKHDIKSLIAHNINFDIGAIYATNNLYGTEDTQNRAFLAGFNKLELSGFFVTGLPLTAAYNVPYKVKSGCATFKADYLVPLLTNGIQAHDALGDCINQVNLYKLTKGDYKNNGTIFGNMLAHHKLKHNNNRHLGTDGIE